jgi:hypothetical protein
VEGQWTGEFTARAVCSPTTVIYANGTRLKSSVTVAVNRNMNLTAHFVPPGYDKCYAFKLRDEKAFDQTFYFCKIL